jgi:POT family proton-dependent oligopeptide transporter
VSSGGDQGARATAVPAPSRIPLPAAAKYIIGTEACERFSFYGMRNILTVFLVQNLLPLVPVPAQDRGARATEIFHLFMMGVFLFPLLGGFLADRRWGKYHTILRLSVLYVAGHALLALFDDNPTGFYAGLFLIALGSGGIKPCVAAFVGDQLTETQRALLPKVFAAFYVAINVGSVVASFLMPLLLEHLGPRIAFGLPGLLMLIALLVFWLGRRHYKELPLAPRNRHGFVQVILSALHAGPDHPERRGLDRALAEHPPEAIEAVRAVLRVLRVFAFIPFFWMLFDQKASTWVLQAKQLDLQVGPFRVLPSQLQLINPALVLMMVPLLAWWIYPALARTRFPLTPLRRMVLGMFLAGLSFVFIALIQMQLDAGHKPSVMWQIGPYVLLTLGEVLVSVTGLEFAYSQAPTSMKSAIQSFWLLTTFAGNLVVAVLARLKLFSGTSALLFYAAVVAAAGIGLALVARHHVDRPYFRRD